MKSYIKFCFLFYTCLFGLNYVYADTPLETAQAKNLVKTLPDEIKRLDTRIADIKKDIQEHPDYNKKIKKELLEALEKERTSLSNELYQADKISQEKETASDEILPTQGSTPEVSQPQIEPQPEISQQIQPVESQPVQSNMQVPQAQAMTGQESGLLPIQAQIPQIQPQVQSQPQVNQPVQSNIQVPQAQAMTGQESGLLPIQTQIPQSQPQVQPQPQINQPVQPQPIQSNMQMQPQVLQRSNPASVVVTTTGTTPSVK